MIVYDWTDLAQVRVISHALDQDIRLDRFAPFSQHHHVFATYTTRTPKSPGVTASLHYPGHTNLNTILLWDGQKLADDTELDVLAPDDELSTLPSKVEHIVGVVRNRLVLYTTDHWIASVELQPHGSPGGVVVIDSFTQHFFLPNDWIGAMVVSNMIFEVGRGGEILLARRSELAVIKRGLEVTEEGGTFHPRRLNNTLRSHPGGRMPYRHRTSASTS